MRKRGFRDCWGGYKKRAFDKVDRYDIMGERYRGAEP